MVDDLQNHIVGRPDLGKLAAIGTEIEGRVRAMLDAEVAAAEHQGVPFALKAQVLLMALHHLCADEAIATHPPELAAAAADRLARGVLGLYPDTAQMHAQWLIDQNPERQ